jgi:hypothetical protein
MNRQEGAGAGLSGEAEERAEDEGVNDPGSQNLPQEFAAAANTAVYRAVEDGFGNEGRWFFTVAMVRSTMETQPMRKPRTIPPKKIAMDMFAPSRT